MTVALKTCRSGRHTYVPRDAANKAGCPQCAREAYERSQDRRTRQLATWRRNNPHALRQIARKAKLKRMGLSVEEFDAMLAEQRGKCPICTTEIALPEGPRNFDRDAVVDHDHESGVIRGLLCHRCNMALGLLRDDRETLSRALAYLSEG